eukprot:3412041-Prymnesium_polylepis.1
MPLSRQRGCKTVFRMRSPLVCVAPQCSRFTAYRYVRMIPGWSFFSLKRTETTESAENSLKRSTSSTCDAQQRAVGTQAQGSGAHF